MPGLKADKKDPGRPKSGGVRGGGNLVSPQSPLSKKKGKTKACLFDTISRASLTLMLVLMAWFVCFCWNGDAYTVSTAEGRAAANG